MSKVSDSIGLKFERTLFDLFPELIFLEGSLVPDFRHQDKSFYLEAKAGNALWGTRIKDYQIDAFQGIREPVIYALGFHNFDHAHARLTQRTEKGRQNCLDRHLDILQINFINHNFMELLWKRERRVSKKEKTPYCMIKPSTLNNVFLNRQFRRFNRPALPEFYYGFSYSDFDFLQENPARGSSYRAILDPETDRGFLKYVRSKGILN